MKCKHKNYDEIWYNIIIKSTFVDWMVANPESNPQLTDNKKFIGIGGHLFAIDVDKSIEYGTDRLS